MQTPAPVLDKISGPMGARFLSSTGLGSGNLLERAQFFPVPALDKSGSPRVGIGKTGLLERGLLRRVHFLEILENFRKRAEYGFGEYGFKHRTQ